MIDAQVGQGAWLIAALHRADRVDADLDGPIDDHTQLAAWWIGQRDRAELDRALTGAAKAIVGARGALLTVGAGTAHGGLLMGLTAATVERAALRTREWAPHPRLSRRLHALLSGMPTSTAALEIRARARPRDVAIHAEWAAALARAGRYAAAVEVMDRTLRRFPGSADAARLTALAEWLLCSNDTSRAVRTARAATRRAVAPREQLEALTRYAEACVAAGRVERACGVWRSVEAAALGLGDVDHADVARVEAAWCGTRGDSAVEIGALPPRPGLRAAAAPRRSGEIEAAFLYAGAAAAKGDVVALEDAWRGLAALPAWALPAGVGRVGQGWAALVSGRPREAALMCVDVLDAPEADADVRAVAAYVRAEADLAGLDGVGADTSVAMAARAFAEAPNADLHGRGGAQLRWMVPNLEARVARWRGEDATAHRLALRAVDALDASRGARIGRWAPDEWLSSRHAPYVLAAELAVGVSDPDTIGALLEGGRWFVSRGVRPPGGPERRRAVERARGAARDEGVELLVLACGTEDVIGWTGAGRVVRSVGAAHVTRQVVAGILDRARVDGALDKLLQLLGQTLERVLEPAFRVGQPLALAPVGLLASVPWERVPVAGRTIPQLRPVIEVPSLLAVARDTDDDGSPTLSVTPAGGAIVPRRHTRTVVAPRVPAPEAAIRAQLERVAERLACGVPLRDAVLGCRTGVPLRLVTSNLRVAHGER